MVRFSSSPSRAAQWYYQCGQRCGVAALLALLMGCKGSRPEPSGATSSAAGGAPGTSGLAQLAAEPERFRFVLPTTYVPRELRGEGSETLLAPPDAVVRSSPNGVRVEAGSDFALEVQFEPALSELPVAAEGAQRVASEKDVVIFKSSAGYWFVALRELVPEWDENERRRVACRSAGGNDSAGALAPERAAGEQRRFSRAAVERMVAACRSLELPRLE
jgi:hypothetical protein